MGCKAWPIVRARTVLRSECVAIHLLGSEIRWFYNVELGTCICAILGTPVLIFGGCFIRDSVCRHLIKNTANQCSSEADLSKLCVSVHISRCSHSSVPGNSKISLFQVFIRIKYNKFNLFLVILQLLDNFCFASGITSKQIGWGYFIELHNSGNAIARVAHNSYFYVL